MGKEDGPSLKSFEDSAEHPAKRKSPKMAKRRETKNEIFIRSCAIMGIVNHNLQGRRREASSFLEKNRLKIVGWGLNHYFH